MPSALFDSSFYHPDSSGMSSAERFDVTSDTGGELTNSLAGNSPKAVSNGQPKSRLSPLPNGMLLGRRYRILRLLGVGGFSDVYLANDEELNRRVAVKRSTIPEMDSGLLLDEARTVASLDHESIVKIFDVLRDDEFGLLIIMQFVSGRTLKNRLEQSKLPTWQAVGITKRLAIAAAHAHSRGVIHRDIKPSNVLFNSQNIPMLSDFGLAVGNSMSRNDPGIVGTLRYMSPEQIRGEQHRIDTRSDIFSLGVVLYQMLTGTLPFDGANARAIRRATTKSDPLPISLHNGEVSFELTLVCMKALKKSIKERYRSMHEFAEALGMIQQYERNNALGTGGSTADHRSSFLSSLARRPEVDSPLLRLTLRPLQFSDAINYLEFAPGERHASGLPQCISHWLEWINSDSRGETQRLGAIYGPTGSGKSSLVLAGIIPHLPADVQPVYIECQKGDVCQQIKTAIESELRLKPSDGSLRDLLERIRIEDTIESDFRKLVLVLDQFETWSKSAEIRERYHLGQALRQCDGSTIQSLIVASDETRPDIALLCDIVEIPLVEDSNAKSMELLSKNETIRILETLAREYGFLQSAQTDPSFSQIRFLQKARDQLTDARHGGVLPINVAIFNQLAMSPHWTAEGLVRQESLAAIYQEYLQLEFESSDESTNASQNPVCLALIKLLLPEYGQLSRERVWSMSEIRNAIPSSVSDKDLQAAIDKLSEEKHCVITSNNQLSQDTQQTFRISSDLLVPWLRRWIKLAESNSRFGRALSRFDYLAQMWAHRPSRDYVPSVSDLVTLSLHRSETIKCPDRKALLQYSKRYYGKRIVATLSGFVLVAAFVSIVLIARHNAIESSLAFTRSQIEVLSSAPPDQIEELINSHRADFDSDLLFRLVENRSLVFDKRVRTRHLLLLAQYRNDVFPQLINLIDWVEVESREVLLVTLKRDGNSVPLLKRKFVTAAEVKARVRAAILLAELDSSESLQRLLAEIDPSNSSAALELTREAVQWKYSIDPWVETFENLPDYSHYYAALVLASFADRQLRPFLPKLTRACASDLNPASRGMVKWLGDNLAFDTESSTLPLESANWSATTPGLDLVKVDSASEFSRIRNGDFSKRLQSWPIGLATISRAEIEQSVWITSRPIQQDLIEEYLATQAPLGETNEAGTASKTRTADQSLLLSETVRRFCNWLSDREGLEPAYTPYPELALIDGSDGYRIAGPEALLPVLIEGHNREAFQRLLQTLEQTWSSRGSSLVDPTMVERRLELPNPAGFVVNSTQMILSESQPLAERLVLASDGDIIALPSDAATLSSPLDAYYLSRPAK